MIAFDFEYYKPKCIDDAIKLFSELESQDKKPIYYGGGTEIICKARVNDIYTKAVIDIKEIPECKVFEENNNEIIIGSATTLTKIRETNIFPLLSKVLRYSSDNTVRNKITIGGNICGSIPYREGVLPFLICDSKVEIAGLSGKKLVNISEVFNKKLKLNKEEILTRIITKKEYTNIPFEFIKRTKHDKVDYPLVSVAAIKEDNQIKMATSGMCAYPFKLKEIEDNIEEAISSIEGTILSDIQGSAKYRKFVLQTILEEILERMGSR